MSTRHPPCISVRRLRDRPLSTRRALPAPGAFYLKNYY